MKKKSLFLICLILFIVSLSAVSAAEDVNQTIIAADDSVGSVDTLSVSLTGDEVVGSADNGTFTDLQKKIDDADEGSTIYLENDYTYNSGFSTSGITINKELTITGNGHVIDALGESRIFYINSPTVTLNNITFKNGFSNDGGAIYFRNSVSNCNISGEFINNTAEYDGGAIYFENSVSNCNISGDFIGNTAYEYGGAIYFYDYSSFTTTVSHCNIFSDFIGNTAYEDGGAIYFRSIISDCTFSGEFINNTAEYDGGAIYFRNSISNCNISGDFISNSASRGGAIYFDLTYNCYILGDFIGNAADNGGAIYFDRYASGCSFSGEFRSNTAADNGGAIYFEESIDGCSFSGDFIGNAADNGGAIYFEGYASGCSFSGEFRSNTVKNYGGAICFGYYSKYDYSISHSNIFSAFISNSASCGGAIYVMSGAYDSSFSGDFMYNFADLGGAIYVGEDPSNCRFSGDFILNCADVGGAIYLSEDMFNCRFSSDFINNYADAGGAIYVNGSVYDSNIINSVILNSIYNPGDFEFVNCWFGNNASNYEIQPYSKCKSWLFLNASSSPINSDEKSTVVFTLDNLYDSSSKSITHPHISDWSDVAFALSAVNGYLNKYSARPGESIIFTSTANTNGIVRATYAGVSYSIPIVKKIDTTLTANDVSVVYNDDSGRLIVELKDASGNPIKNAKVKITVGNLTKSMKTLSSGKAYINTKTLNIGDYIATIIFAGDDKYNAATTTANVSVKIGVVLAAENVVVAYQDATGKLIAELKDTNGNPIGNAKVKFTVGDLTKAMKTYSNGKAYISTKTLDIGNYTATVSFAGDDYYAPASTTANVTVKKIDTTLTAKDIAVVYNDDSGRLIVELKDADGNPIAGAKVKITLGSLTKTMKTYDSGKAFISTKSLAVGDYVATVSFAGDDKYAPVSATANVAVRIGTALTFEDVIVVYNDDSGRLIVELKDASGNPIGGAKVKISVGNLTKTMKTYSSGKAFISTKSLALGGYIATVSFEGDNNYAPASTTANVIVKKTDAILIAEDVSVIYNDDSGRLIVQLKDANGNPISGAKVKITVGGLTKSMKTYSSGKAYISTKSLAVGDYVATVSFAGDDNYGAASTTAKVAVRMGAVLTAKDVVATKGDSSKLIAELKDSEGNPISGVKVKFTLGNLTKTMDTSASGKAYINTKTLALGNYVAVISCPDNEKCASSSITANVSIKA